MSGRSLRSKRSLAEAHLDNEDDATTASFNGALSQFEYSKKDHGDVDRKTTAGQKLGPSSSTMAVKDRRIPQHTSPSTSPLKKQRSSSKYVAPSKYAHLPLLNDILADDLLILFIGLNPGITTAESGHAYAHPSNLFWKLLFASGITDRRCSPEEDVEMPRLYQCGFTNIVSRPSKDMAELDRRELVQGAPALEVKANRWRPEVCCLVGKGIWEAVYKSRLGSALPKDKFRYGWQSEQDNMGRDEDWAGARVFVAASTSGASASLRPPEKEAIWKPLGNWIRTRRKQRGIVSAEQDTDL